MERVYLAECRSYDAAEAEEGIRDAIDALGVQLPHGKTVFVKPNCVWAHPKYAPAAFTNPQIIKAIVRLLADNEIVVGENSLAGIPTSYSYRKAGYHKLAKEEGFKLIAIDEAPTTRVKLKQGAVHSDVALPNHFLQSSFFVSLPKLKTSTYVPFTAALKLNLGLLQDGEMVWKHHRLAEKVVDLLEVANPDLIIVDAIEVGEGGGSLTCLPKPFGMLMVGTNAVAVDAVAAASFGLAPEEVEYLKLAHEQGYGPIDLGEIEVLGDFSLAELIERGRGLQQVDPHPESRTLPTQVNIVRGSPYRPTGTAGALTEFLLLLERGGVDLGKARETTIVIGSVEGELIGKTDTSAIVFLGDDARSRHRGFSRVVRMRGESIPLKQLLDNLPFIMKIASPRDEFMGELAWAGLLAGIARWRDRLRSRSQIPSQAGE